MMYTLAPGGDSENYSSAKAIFHDTATAMKSKENVLIIIILEPLIMKTIAYLKYMFFSESPLHWNVRKGGERLTGVKETEPIPRDIGTEL